MTFIVYAHLFFALSSISFGWFCITVFQRESNRYSRRKSTLGNFTIERPKE